MGRARPSSGRGKDSQLPRHIGIVGVSPEGSSFCYRIIGRRAAEVENPEKRPLVSLHNRPFSSYLEALAKDDWPRIAELLRDSAIALSHIGADFCVLPDNVCHHAIHLAEAHSPIPWLNMIDLVAGQLQHNGCRKVGLIGTKFVTSGSTYQTVLGLRGIHLLVPPEEDTFEVNRIIFSEAVKGRVRAESRDRVLRVVRSLADRGCEAVVLGSSEAPMLINSDSSPIPVFDPVDLLAEAAISRALAPKQTA